MPLPRPARGRAAGAGLTRGASSETRKTGVRVNAVLPGIIETNMIERKNDEPELRHLADIALERHSVGRFGKPEDVGYAIKWLLSDEAAFVNGVALPADGGYTEAVNFRGVPAPSKQFSRLWV